MVFSDTNDNCIDLNDTPWVPSPVYAVEDGLITIESWGAYGKRINLKFWNLQFSYCHLSEIFVKAGEKVKAGDLIWMTWNTASYNMPIHLHFMCKELDGNGYVINRDNGYDGSIPMEVIDGEIHIKTTQEISALNPFKDLKRYKGIQVVIKKEQGGREMRNGFYNPYSKQIVLYPYFFTHSVAKQRAILAHEFSHHVQFYRLPDEFIETWIKVYQYDEEMISNFNERSSKDFDGQKFLNSHAQKAWTEDFSEQIERRVLIEAWEEEIPEEWTLRRKYEIACIMHDMHKKNKDLSRDIDAFIYKYITSNLLPK